MKRDPARKIRVKRRRVEAFFKLVSGLRGDTGGAQRKTSGTARSGGTDRFGRGFGRRWTAALRS